MRKRTHPPLSALVVEVPAAESAVSQHRDRLDSNARLGVPAHITVLFPFMPAADITPSTRTDLGQLLASQPSFRLDLVRTAWFADQVLWLAPEDPQPFEDLTRLVHAAFPNFPPYGGQHDDPVPHLTVAHGCELTEMEAAEGQLRDALPIRAHITEVTLLAQSEDTGSWKPLTKFALGDPTTA